jgi:hypothetical protein
MGPSALGYLDAFLGVFAFALLGIVVQSTLNCLQRLLAALEWGISERKREIIRRERFFFEVRKQLAGLTEQISESRMSFRQAGEVEEIERALRGDDWKEASRLLDALKASHPSHPQLDRLDREIEAGRARAIEARLEHIRASREANDAARVLELFEEVAPILESATRRSLETDLAGWFMALIQRRLRTGTIQSEVVVLSGRVADLFGGTPEGASLRAGLPTLRRTVGLCPRCAGPYLGVADACPDCLASAIPRNSIMTPGEPPNPNNT